MRHTKRYFENVMHFDGYDYHVEADLNFTFEGYGSPDLDVEITSIEDEDGKEVLGSCEWVLYNEFMADIAERTEY